MILHRAVLCAAAVLALNGWAAPSAEAACSEEKIQAMAEDGRSTRSIARACGMSNAKVRGVIEGIEAGAVVKALPVPPATPAPAPEPDPAAGKLPAGSALARCDCQGWMPAGEKAPESRCQSGMSITAPCPGYCPPRGIAPWRRVCS
ncbi:hypothetical protein C1I89_02335 [Achromobacter pulmonis]|uniref:Uncharacterized protein n=1 Tax=Achromobacter pulmonis TaxID=1389932 RepID=A0A2N8KP86_9BURK|nr:hypothetical protein [Achromobacter pulmonis]PND35249.1 hypothetical protein C1I89_02335 [Achromobacter pulmonis]